MIPQRMTTSRHSSVAVATGALQSWPSGPWRPWPDRSCPVSTDRPVPDKGRAREEEETPADGMDDQMRVQGGHGRAARADDPGAQGASRPLQGGDLVFRADDGRRRLGRERELPDHRFRSEEHTSELQSLMRIPYAAFCLKK